MSPSSYKDIVDVLSPLVLKHAADDGADGQETGQTGDGSWLDQAQDLNNDVQERTATISPVAGTRVVRGSARGMSQHPSVRGLALTIIIF